ncbi:MAG: NADH:flavin oxidoreductase [Chloroflexi bacterium]|nr:NADH:flavin oxidoreductase [Chloroflexota bacterium]
MAANPFFPRLFEPGQIGNLKLKNRLVMAPLTTNMASPTGEVTQGQIDHYAESARGGVGLVIIEATCVDSPVGKLVSCETCLDAEKFIPGHFALVEAVHAEGAKVGLQLHHAGRQSNLRNTDGRQLVSSSPVPANLLLEMTLPTPHELTIEGIYELMDKFAAAAERAKAAGYDLVELHAAHGYLLTQFMSPYFNKRTDEFGGSYENRMRFALGIIERVKEACGSDYPVTMRINGDEFIEGGIDTKLSPVIAKTLEKAGIVAIHISSGIYETLELSNDSMPCQEGWKGYIAEAVTSAVGVPTIAVGGFKNPDFCEKTLAEGKANFIALGNVNRYYSRFLQSLRNHG